MVLISAEQATYFAILFGLGAIFVIATIVDKLGNVFFQRGFARPFYLRGRRIHHRVLLYRGLPVLYIMIVLLVLMGYVQVVWVSFWPGIEATFSVAAACMALDLTWDSLSSGVKKRAIIHHEWVYLAIPVFVFNTVLRLTI